MKADMSLPEAGLLVADSPPLLLGLNPAVHGRDGALSCSVALVYSSRERGLPSGVLEENQTQDRGVQRAKYPCL